MVTDKIINFEEDMDPYDHLNIGSHRTPVVGDKIYMKPNALELYENRMNNIPIGDSRNVQLWRLIVASFNPSKSTIIKQIDNTNIELDTHLGMIVIERYMVSFLPNDKKHSLELL